MSPSLQCGETEVGDKTRSNDKNTNLRATNALPLSMSDCDTEDSLAVVWKTNFAIGGLL